MRELSFCITEAEEIRDAAVGETVSIVFPGTSVEGLDLGRLDGTTTITMNEMIGRICADYTIIVNERALESAMLHFRYRAETNLVISSEVAERLDRNPPIDYRSGLNAAELTENLDGVTFWDDWSSERSVSTVALDLAKWLGANRVDLYGLDLCSPVARTHAYGVRTARDRDGIEVAPGLYQFDGWKRVQREIEEAATTMRWGKMKICNRSEISVLDCFSKGCDE